MNQAFKRHSSAILFFAVVTLLVSLPAVFNLTTHIIGSGGDPWQTLWRFEQKTSQLTAAMTTHQLGAYAAEEFFGGGLPRLVNLSVWPWLWLHVLVGEPLAYNLIWLLSYVVAGYAMYLLMHWLLSSHIQSKNSVINSQQEVIMASVLAGLYYMLLPYHVAHSFGHFGAMQVQWLPLLVLVGLLFLKQPTLWRIVGLVVLFTVQAWTEHHYALWFVLFAAIALTWRLVIDPSWRRWHGRLSYLTLLVAVLALYPTASYLPTIRLAQSPTNTLDLGWEQTIRFSADLFAYVVPAPFQSIWGGLFNTIFSSRFSGNVTEATHYLGVTALLLIAFFHQHIPRATKRFWLTIAAFFLVLSLGPRLHILGALVPIPLPFSALDSLPVFSVIRAIGRSGVMVGLATAVLLGWVIATQVKRPAFAVVIGLLILIEFLYIPVPRISAALSPAYEVVGSLPGTHLIELPAATNYAAASRALYASNRHGKSIVGNIALERAFTADELWEAQSLPALRQLLYLRTSHIREDRDDFFAQDPVETIVDTFTWLDIGGILIHTDSLSSQQLSAVRAWLQDDLHLTPQVFDDALLYATGDLPATITDQSDGVFLARDDRWENVRFDAITNTIYADVSNEATTVLYNVREVPVTVELTVTLAPSSTGSLVVTDNATTVADLSGEISGATVTIPLTLSPGSHELTWRNRVPGTVRLQNPTLHVVPSSRQ